MKIQKRLLLSHMLLSIGIFLLALVIFLSQYISDLVNEQEVYTINLTDSILTRVEGMVEEIDRMINVVYNTSDFEKHITDSAALSEDDSNYAYNFLQTDLFLKDDLSYFAYNENIVEDIILIDNTGGNYYIGSNMFNYNKDFRVCEFYNNILKADGKYFIFSEGCEELYKDGTDDLFAIAKVLKSRENLENIGVIITTVRLEMLKDMFENYLDRDTQRCMILWGNEILVNSSPELKAFECDWSLNDVNCRERIDGEDYLVYGKASDETEFKILWLSPVDLMREKIYYFLNYSILITILIIVSCFLVSFFISKIISRPIVRLEAMTKIMATGELRDTEAQELEKYTEKSEVGQLYLSFQRMKTEINRLLLKERKSRTEFLANQINPHFLYNTLDTAYMSAIANDDMDTSEIIGQINSLLKLIVREPGMVTLDKELKIVNAYVTIQEMRYPDKFEYKVFVSEEVRQKVIPKMILQPIVENAIQHGVLEVDDYGFIYIKVECNEEVLFIRVINGPGRKLEGELLAINHSIKNSDVYGVTHIGLKNIYERLILNYPDGVYITVVNSKEYDGIEVDLKIDLKCCARGENHEENKDTDCR